MKRRQWIVMAGVVAVLAAAGECVRAEETPEKAAQAAAEKWLAMVDGGKFAESWAAAADYFRGAVTKDQWVAQLGGVRKPLGEVKSRVFQQAKSTKTAPGAPDGEYMILTFKTAFAHKAEAIETVTPMRDKDGQWRVAGYFIR